MGDGGPVAKRSGRRDRGALEAEVLAALQRAEQPMTARQVHDGLDGGLAYTTVMTTLARLHTKGALSRELLGRAFVYRLAGDTNVVDAAVTARRMRKLLEAGADRNVALSRFVSELEPQDEAFLSGLLRTLDAERQGDGQP
ncbi:MAG: BlaI/MecI/CopY family transcriptional regulator [Actinomycetales bacterium]